MCDCILIVPCYNEAARLNASAFVSFLAQDGRFRILFVDDGSKDATAAILDQLAASDHDRMRVLHLSTNQGKAEAVRQGVLAALRENPKYVGYWDADLATPLDAAVSMCRLLDDRPDVDLVLGSRVKLLGRSIERRAWRHYIGRCFATAVSLLLGVGVYDTQCGAKLLRVGPAMASVFSRPFLSRWIFDVELLRRWGLWLGENSATSLESVVYEVPLDSWRDVAGSKLGWNGMFQSAFDLCRLVAGGVGLRRSERTRFGDAPVPEVARVRRANAAYTLVEVLVAIAIMGVLVALLMPAVQMAREAARRAQCQSQLHQIGLALHQYHGANNCLPMSVGPWVPSGSTPTELNGKGWIVSILPQLEQPGLGAQFEPYLRGDFFSGGGIRAPGCLPLVQTRLPVLHCPSDGTVRQLSATQYQWEGTRVALTSYKGVIGDTRMGGMLSIHPGSMPDCHSVGGCNGLFFRTSWREPQRFSLIHDGTSNTFMVGEDVAEHNDHSAAFYSNGDYASCHAPLNYFPDPPDPKNWPDVMSFRSRHPGGAHFCLADGSVRFISESIDHPTYRALSTKNRGEAVSADGL